MVDVAEVLGIEIGLAENMATVLRQPPPTGHLSSRPAAALIIYGLAVLFLSHGSTMEGTSLSCIVQGSHQGTIPPKSALPIASSRSWIDLRGVWGQAEDKLYEPYAALMEPCAHL